MGTIKSSTPGRPTKGETVAWSLHQSRAIRDENAGWIARWREVPGSSPPGGEILLDRDRFAAGVWLRLPKELRPSGNRLPGARQEINSQLALIFASRPWVIDAAVAQFAREVAECRLAEAGIRIGGGR